MTIQNYTSQVSAARSIGLIEAKLAASGATQILKEYEVTEKPDNVVAYLKPDVWFRPKIVFEIIYEEIQTSPDEKHSAGFGLRFPRFVKIREDKTEEDINTVEDIKTCYSIQKEK